MRETRRVQLPVPGATSLIWVDGHLVDVSAGWRSVPLTGGEPQNRYTAYGSEFDAAVVSPNGDLVLLVVSAGTKGLVLDSAGRVVREVNRSFYHADAYRYPGTLFTLPDGRTGLVHCPEQYNRLEIEDALTGERLTADSGRQPKDVFHSRLAVSADGRYLLSAGWLWHPWGCLAVYDLAEALRDPTVLDGYGNVFDLRGLIEAEVGGACFVGNDLLVSTTAEPNDPESADDLAPNMLVRRSLGERRFTWRRDLGFSAGDLVPMAGGALSLNGHPRWWDASSGELRHEWPDLPTGDSDSSIVFDKAFSGPARIAVDEAGRRLAVTNGEEIVVVWWDDQPQSLSRGRPAPVSGTARTPSTRPWRGSRSAG